MNRPGRLRWTQLSLTRFLWLTLVLGLLLGVVGPPAYRWMREQWTKKPPVQTRPIDGMASPAPQRKPSQTTDEQWKAWQSAETPLD